MRAHYRPQRVLTAAAGARGDARAPAGVHALDPHVLVAGAEARARRPQGGRRAPRRTHLRRAARAHREAGARTFTFTFTFTRHMYEYSVCAHPLG